MLLSLAAVLMSPALCQSEGLNPTPPWLPKGTVRTAAPEDSGGDCGSSVGHSTWKCQYCSPSHTHTVTSQTAPQTKLLLKKSQLCVKSNLVKLPYRLYCGKCNCQWITPPSWSHPIRQTWPWAHTLHNRNATCPGFITYNCNMSKWVRDSFTIVI